MKRCVKVDPLIKEVIQKQTEKCKKILEYPNHQFFERAQKFLNELETLTKIISQIERLSYYPNECMSQDDEGANHFFVKYVSSKVELKSIINKAKKKKHTILSFGEDGMLCDTIEDVDNERYVNIFEVISYQPAPEEYIIEEMCRRVDDKGIKTSEQLRELFETVKVEKGYGEWATYYVTIMKNF